MLITLGYAAAILVGISLGLIGAGGSILTVPIFVYLFGLPPEVATSYSLFVVGATAAYGSNHFFRQKLVDPRMGLLFAIPSFAGVFWARRFVLPSVPANIDLWGDWSLSRGGFIMLVFALIMLAASISMIRSTTTLHAPPPGPSFQRRILIMGLGFIVGAVAGFVGAGGGFLTIPALVLLLGMTMKKAVGTSLMIIAIQSLFGFFSTIESINSVDWLFVSTFAILAGVGIMVGNRLSRLISGERLKPAFGWFVLVMGFYIIGQELSK